MTISQWLHIYFTVSLWGRNDYSRNLNYVNIYLVAQRIKHLPAVQETWVWSLGWEDSLEKEMAPHSSILAWRIPWIEEPGRLQSTGSQRVGHDWATSLSLSNTYLESLNYKAKNRNGILGASLLVQKSVFFLPRMCRKLLQSCLTLCEPVAPSPSGSSDLGTLLQA